MTYNRHGSFALKNIILFLSRKEAYVTFIVARLREEGLLQSKMDGAHEKKTAYQSHSERRAFLPTVEPAMAMRLHRNPIEY